MSVTWVVNPGGGAEGEWVPGTALGSKHMRTGDNKRLHLVIIVSIF